VQLRAPDPPGSFRTAGLHLVVLCAFAFAQPLFDILGRNAPFFAVRGAGRLDVLVFAFGLVVVPPLALLALEALAGLPHRRAATAIHLAFVAILAALVCLQAIRGIEGPDALLVAAAGAAGVAAAFLYERARVARVLLSVLGPAPFLFLGLFLLVSPVSRLVLASAPEPRLAHIASRTPVVLVVFDEFPTVSLMDAHEEIDVDRYPNFARLARDAIWFRNATTVHEWTTSAVPAILTGRNPEKGALPLYLDHPDNLFTLLGGGYDLHVTETVTHLCPGSLCPQGRGGRLRSILSDITVVYPHLLLPDGLRERITPLGDAWSGFRGAGGRPPVYLHRDAQARRFVEGIVPGPRPRLFFLHVLLPHHPWEYLPDGKRYASALPWQPGLVDDRWTGDPELAVQAWQRHLLQVGFTDLILGEILDRLEAQGLYDDALVIVTADHGVSFSPHGERRRVNEGNLEQIAFVPLLVKLPHARAGRVEDAHVQTLDILPTIADVLDVRVPWRTDGRSALGVRRGDEPRVGVWTSAGELVSGDAAGLGRRRAALLSRQLELFGAGNWQPGLFRIGPHRELLGRAVDGLAVARPGSPSVRLIGGTTYDPDSPLAPVHVAGLLFGAGAGEDLAVAVGGRIQAMTRSYDYGGKTWFSAVVPESAFHSGSNAVRLFLVESEGGSTSLVEAPPNGA
jgi:sulfatase-like protein